MPLLLLLIIAFFFPLPAHAQTLPKNTITVVPSIVNLDLHKASPDVTLYYTNTTKSVVELALSARDFSGLSDNGQLAILDPEKAKSYQYRLSSWIQFDTNTITLNPGEKKTVHVTIEKEQLPVGGHYGAIFAQVVLKAVRKPLKLQPIIASLVFVRSTSEFNREEAKVVTANPDTTFPYFPQNFLIRLHNTGNIQLVPYGLIQITDISGKLVAKGILNEGSLFLLPESLRTFTVPIRPVQSFLWPGMYHLTFQMHYGTSKKVVTTTQTFFSQGSLDLVKIGGVILILLIGFGIYRKIKN